MFKSINSSVFYGRHAASLQATTVATHNLALIIPDKYSKFTTGGTIIGWRCWTLLPLPMQFKPERVDTPNIILWDVLTTRARWRFSILSSCPMLPLRLESTLEILKIENRKSIYFVISAVRGESEPIWIHFQEFFPVLSSDTLTTQTFQVHSNKDTTPPRNFFKFRWPELFCSCSCMWVMSRSATLQYSRVGP